MKDNKEKQLQKNTNKPKDDCKKENKESGSNNLLEERKPHIQAIIDIVESSGATLFHDQYREPYIAYYGDGSEIAKTNSKLCRSWLNMNAYAIFRMTPTNDAINRVISNLSARALYEGLERTLNVRTAHNSDGLWYDLGRSVVQITDQGWEVIDASIPIIFKRHPHQKPQITPELNGDIELLLKYVNINKKSDKLLFLVYVIAAFIPDYPRPLLILYGAQGAGKTTPMKIIKELLDPSALSGLPSPKNIEAFVQTMNHHSFMFYDNLSKMPEWFSDALARVATGDSFSKRELYTDDEDVIYSFQRVIALNGINQVVYKSDLLDRSLLLNLERITPEKRKEAQIFWKEFYEDKALILGGVFDVLAKALAIYPKVKLERLPRMADFARWGYAIAEASGYSGTDFINAYTQNITAQHDEAIEANPVSQAIVELMAEIDEWRGTPSRLYAALRKIASSLEIIQSRGWPKDAARLGRALTSIAPNLLSRGILLDRSRGKDRLITISKITVDSDEVQRLKAGKLDSKDSATASSVQEEIL